MLVSLRNSIYCVFLFGVGCIRKYHYGTGIHSLHRWENFTIEKTKFQHHQTQGSLTITRRRVKLIFRRPLTILDLWKWLVSHDSARTDINRKLKSTCHDYITRKFLKAGHHKAMSAAVMGNHDHLFSFWSEANKKREDGLLLVRKPLIICKYMLKIHFLIFFFKGITAVLKPTCATI